MILEQQCISLPLARRLKELGVKQESLFWWTSVQKSEWRISYGSTKKASLLVKETFPFIVDLEIEELPAYSVAELGEMLPPNDNLQQCFSSREPKRWICLYSQHEWSGEAQEEADNEANARAKMLIHLIEQVIVKV